MGMYLNKKVTLLTNNAKPSVREVIINMINWFVSYRADKI